MKRVSRNRARVSYYEPEEPSFDEYIFCSSCGDYVYEYCSIHGSLLIIPDEEVPTPTGFPAIVPRAALTIPRGFLHLAPSAIPDAGIGVFSTLTLPAGVRFGPYRGLKTDEASSTYCWQIFDRDHKPAHMLDARDPNKSNWMRYVNCSRHHSEQNLVAYQYQGQLYYRTIRIIPRFTELLVFYGSEFASRLDIDIFRYHSPVHADILVKAENGAQKSKSFVNNDTSTALEEDYLQNSLKHESNCETVVEPSESIVVNLKDLKEEHVDKMDDNNKVQHNNFICNDCGQVFDEKPTLIDHIAIHSTVKSADNITTNKTKVFKYCCLTCNSKFVRKSDLINHEIKIHNSKIKYKACSECDYKTNHSNNLRRHIETHSNNLMCGYKCDNITINKTQVFNYACSTCNLKFARKSDLINHEIKIHNSKIKYKACTECNYKTNNNSHLRRHIKTHSDTLICGYKCDICTYAAFTYRELKQHANIHTQVKLYSCQICGLKFNKQIKLTIHSMIHESDRIYPCTICEYRGKSNYHLKRHTLVHSEEKPFTCMICNTSFNRRHSLTKHTRLHGAD